MAGAGGLHGRPARDGEQAVDSWLPHRFAACSERLTMRDGVLLMGGGAAAILVYTGGDVTHLVCHVQHQCVRDLLAVAACDAAHWLQERGAAGAWKKNLVIHAVGLVLSLRS